MIKYLVALLAITLITQSAPAQAEVKYVKPELSELHRAAFYGKNDLVTFYAQAGADVNVLAGNDNTPLHIAAFRGQTEAVRILLVYGADRSLKNVNGKTALDIANKKSFQLIAELLETY
jgi:ankyrin repeat protein